MTDEFVPFADLPPSLRAQALIGSYLQSWSHMESDLDEAIQVALGLEPLQGLIVCKNIQLRDKIYILKSVIALNDPHSKHRADIKALTDIAEIARLERNVIAHEAFGPDNEGDGVRFIVMKAKGKLSFPKTRWSIDDFLDKLENLSRLSKILQSVASRFRRRTPDLASLLKEPNNALFALAYPDPPTHHPQGSPGLGLLVPNLRKDAETPEDPQE